VPTPLLSPAGNNKTTSPTTRILDLYTKNGGIGAYNTQFALSPDQGFGFSVLTAGRPPTSGPDLRQTTMFAINQVVTEIFTPAFEKAALEQAVRNFAGTYVASDNTTSPQSLTIVAGDGPAGLGVQNWTSGDLDLVKSYFAAKNLMALDEVPGQPTLRLYPMDLHNGKQVAFRGVYEIPNKDGVYSSGSRPFEKYCATWSQLSEPQYGNIGLDDFVFDIDEMGKATAITARGERKTLKRT